MLGLWTCWLWHPADRFYEGFHQGCTALTFVNRSNCPDMLCCMHYNWQKVGWGMCKQQKIGTGLRNSTANCNKIEIELLSASCPRAATACSYSSFVTVHVCAQQHCPLVKAVIYAVFSPEIIYTECIHEPCCTAHASIMRPDN
jgi:hypothetical protein